jgi:hypothetical protein
MGDIQSGASRLLRKENLQAGSTKTFHYGVVQTMCAVFRKFARSKCATFVEHFGWWYQNAGGSYCVEQR